ncbi:hypothetical protein OD91_0863 [Lutibacter sp. Hel_I_33_5]|nr:hypothetical protein OD91_0863 [Lutibacter sp. Hel_I_33_5]
MNPNLKLILVIFSTFLIAFITSLLLELELFKNLVRYILVVLLIIFELYLGFIVYQSLYKK